MIINMNDLDISDIIKIQYVKNSTIKIIILDVNDIEQKLLLYDYKILRPINKDKINYLLNLIYTANQFNSSNIHNEIIINNNIQKIKNINLSPKLNDRDLNSIKILIAEDNKQNQFVIIELLNSLSYTNIVLVDNGLDAYDKLINEDYDIAFIDLKMTYSGFQVITNYKKYFKENNIIKNTILIAVTASVSQEVKEKSFSIGFNGFITKPINKQDFETTLKYFK